MKNILIYLSIVGLGLMFAEPTLAQTSQRMTYSTMTPSPVMKLCNLEYVDCGSNLGDGCTQGTLAIDSNFTLMHCPSGNFEVLSPWVQNGDNVTLVDSANADIKVGIGPNANPEFRLSVEGDGAIIAKGTYGSGDDLITTGEGARMIWYPKKGAFRAGRVDTTFGLVDAWDDGNISNNTVSFGWNNKAGPGADNSFIGGGGMNEISNFQGTIGGGWQNIVTGNSSTVGGGAGNTAGGGALGMATVAGGGANQATGYVSTVGGGGLNLATGIGATVPGGGNNEAHGDYSVAMGRFMHLENTAHHSFAFGYSAVDVPHITRPDVFIIYPGTNVGVGTIDPQGLFHIEDEDPASTNLRITNTTGTSAHWELRAHEAAPVDGFSIWGGAEGSESTRLVINSDGNVGIGTDTPTQRLHINSTLRLEPQDAAPTVCTAAELGTLYVDTADSTLCYCDGAAWDTIVGAGPCV